MTAGEPSEEPTSRDAEPAPDGGRNPDGEPSRGAEPAPDREPTPGGESTPDDESKPDAPPTAGEAPAPSSAFQALGGEPRTSIVRTLAEDGPATFSALHDATDVDTSAGFAYHLRQLDGHFVRKQRAGADGEGTGPAGTDGESADRYELTAAGRAAARAIRAGTYTDSVDWEAVPLAEPCPFCAEAALGAAVADNVTRIGCEACGEPVLELSLPPSGYDTREPDSVPGALDAYHRRRIAAFADGVCPDCGGEATARVEPVVQPEGEESGGSDADPPAPDDDREDRRVRAAFDCAGCGAELSCPVALTLLAHPAVVAFYRDHGEDVRERPIWNVGPEWGEWLLSWEPVLVIVCAELDGERLELYVAVDGTVVDDRRTAIAGDRESAPGAGTRRPDDDDDGPGPTPAEGPPAAADGRAGERSEPGAPEEGDPLEDQAGGDGATA